jgi:hypothetical protein
MAERIITRTFVENPDANKDVYRTEDHLRDLAFNESKLKQLVEAVFTTYPGWLNFPTVAFDLADPRKFSVGPFRAIDGNTQLILSEGMSNIEIPDYQLNIPYYAIVRAILLPTEDRRKNSERGNILYQYILREQYVIEFVNEPPSNELCLGQFTYLYNSETGTTYGVYSTVGRTALLPSVSGIVQALNEYVNASDSKFLVATKVSEGGDVGYVTGSNPFIVPPNRTKPIVVGINEDGRIGSGLIPWDNINERIQKTITIPGKSNGIENNYVEILTSSRNQILKLRNMALSIHGEIAFDTGPVYGGAAVAITTSEKVFTQDYVDMELADNVIYITGTNTTLTEEQGGTPVVMVKIRNNFWNDIELQVEFIR